MGNINCFSEVTKLENETQRKGIFSCFQEKYEINEQEMNFLCESTCKISNRYSKLYIEKKKDNFTEFILRVDSLDKSSIGGDSITVALKIYNKINLPPYKFQIIDNKQQNSLKHNKNVVEMNSGENHTIRIIPFVSYEDYAFKHNLNQIYILRKINKINQKNIVKFFDAYITENQDGNKRLILIFEAQNYLLLDLMKFRIQNQFFWKPEELILIFKELNIALNVLHKNFNICHRGLTPNNIFYSLKDGVFKISGFEFSKIIQNPQKERKHSIYDLGKLFTSPEIKKSIKNEETIGIFDPFLEDIYTLGVTYYTMLTLKFEISRENLENELDEFGIENKLCIEIILKMMNITHWRRILITNFKDFIKDSEQIKFERSDELNKVVFCLEKQQKAFEAYRAKKNCFIAEKVFSEDIYIKKQLAQNYCDLLQFEDSLQIFSELDIIYNNIKDYENKARNLILICNSLENLNDFQEVKKVSKNTYKIMIYLHKNANSFEKSCEFLRAALEISTSPSEKIAVYKKLANLFKNQGNFEEAHSYLEAAFQLSCMKNGEISFESIKINSNLGSLLGKLNKPNEGITKLLHCASNLRNSFLTNPKRLKIYGIVLCNLGEFYRNTKKINLAQKYLEDALKVEKGLYGNNHIEVIKTQENLATLYYDLEKYNLCLEKYEYTLIFKKRDLGDFHPEVGITLMNLGNVYRKINDYEKALIYYENSLKIFRRSFGDKHYYYGLCLGFIGITQKNVNKNNDNGNILIKEALNIIENTGKCDNSDYLLIKKEYQH